MGVSLGSWLPTEASLGDLTDGLSLLCDNLRWVGVVTGSLLALLEFLSGLGLQAVCPSPWAVSAGGGGRRNSSQFRPSAETRISFQGNQQDVDLDAGRHAKGSAWP